MGFSVSQRALGCQGRRIPHLAVCTASRGQPEEELRQYRRPRNRRHRGLGDHGVVGRGEDADHGSAELQKLRRKLSSSGEDETLVDDSNAMTLLELELQAAKDRLEELDATLTEETEAPNPVPSSVSRDPQLDQEDHDALMYQVDYALKLLEAKVSDSSHNARNLQPFRAQEESSKVCESCNGEGARVCDYCKGKGYVKFPDSVNPLKVPYQDTYLYRATRASGELYYCPLCGGLRRERCQECWGSGKSPPVRLMPTGVDRSASGAEESGEGESTQTETTAMGVRIIRARKKRVRSKKPVTEVPEKDRKSATVSKKGEKRRRGRPRKEDEIDLERELTLGLQKAARANRDPTGFRNTTMFKVGKDLREKPPLQPGGDRSDETDGGG